MPSIRALSLRIPVRNPTLISLDLPEETLSGIAGKRKKLLTCTQEIIREKSERLRLASLIHSDHKTTTRHAMALSKAKGLISLLEPIMYY
jgi:hypothetical protein